MSRLPVQNDGFRVDTSRPRSRTKMRAKIRTVLGVSAGMLPLMALVIFLMSAAFFGKGFGSLGWAVVADTAPKQIIGTTGY